MPFDDLITVAITVSITVNGDVLHELTEFIGGQLGTPAPNGGKGGRAFTLGELCADSGALKQLNEAMAQAEVTPEANE